MSQRLMGDRGALEALGQRPVMAASVSSQPRRQAVLRTKSLARQGLLWATLRNSRSRPTAVGRAAHPEADRRHAPHCSSQRIYAYAALRCDVFDPVSDVLRTSPHDPTLRNRRFASAGPSGQLGRWCHREPSLTPSAPWRGVQIHTGWTCRRFSPIQFSEVNLRRARCT